MSNSSKVKFNFLNTFDKVVYNLVYPGFVGSMLYELLPTEKSQLNVDFAFSEINLIKYSIITFYVLDYFHLYGYVHEIVPENKRKFWYIFTDFVVSLILFIAYFHIKWGNYSISTLLVLIILGVLLIGYKRKNKFDWYFILPQLIVLLVFNYKILNYFNCSEPTKSLIVIFLATISYGVYIFYYFPIFAQYVKDEKLYEL